MSPEFHIIRGTWATWDEMFTAAADVATHVGPDNLISISHSADAGEAVITVWYWPTGARPSGRTRRAAFQVFRGAWASWQRLFDDAAHFAGQTGPDRLIDVAHSEDKDEGVVTVWYWE